MSLSASLSEILEWRGVCDLVAAEILTDDNGTDGYTTGSVYAIAGVATIEKSVEENSEAHYYDNMAAIVIDSTGADTITIDVSAIPIEVQAWLTGQTYLSTKGALIEGPATRPYFALGYKTQKTNGDEVYVWRLKGKFTEVTNQSHNTQDNSTNANGQQLVYTGINTTHKWTQNNSKGAKALVVDTSLELADVSTFFDTVTTPDSLTVAS